MGPTAKSLVLDLLSTVRKGSLPVRALIAAGELFGIDPNAVRVALTRLGAQGLVESDERGAYRLGPGAASVVSLVSGWRTVEDRVREWDGTWVAVLTSALPRSDRAAVRSAKRALRFLGLRELEDGLALRPDNLVGGASHVREQLAVFGVDERAAVFGLRDLDAARDAHARKLWDAERLERGYREALERLAKSAQRLERLAPERAMTESFLVGGRTIRAIVLDPLLPEPIAPAAERRKLVAAMRDYDRLGRRCWAAFLNEHGAPHLDAPHDLRAMETSLPRAAAGGRT